MSVGAGVSDHAFVVPAYGDSPFLEACLTSLRSQTISSSVLITTSTPSEFITRHAKAFGVDLLINPRREGIAADWNFALAAASARYVTLAHQDDLYFAQFVEESLRLLCASGAAIAFTGYEEVSDSGAYTASKISHIKHLIERVALGEVERPSWRRMKCFLSFGNPLPCSSVTFDSLHLSNFQFSSDFSSNLDWEAWLRLLGEGYEFTRTPRRLVGRRHNPLTETSRLIRNGIRAREDAQMFERLWPPLVSRALSRIYRIGY